jgi:hypothetical protein
MMTFMKEGGVENDCIYLGAVECGEYRCSRHRFKQTAADELCNCTKHLSFVVDIKSENLNAEAQGLQGASICIASLIWGDRDMLPICNREKAGG